ncbi:MAG: DsbA family protein [Patescibacteria group bacterium]
MAQTETSENKPKKWHQKWWGIFFLFGLAIMILYVAAFVFQFISLVDAQNQLANKYATALPSQAIDLKDIIETPYSVYSGPLDAGIVIVEFSDFQCPYCKEAYPIIKSIRQEYAASVKIIYRDFPNLAIHPNALNAALAGKCANEQNNFWPYHDLLFENQSDLSLENLKSLAVNAGLDQVQFNQCLDSQKYLAEIQNDLQAAQTLELAGTPAFFINGSKVEGVIPYDSFKSIIEQIKQQELSNK